LNNISTIFDRILFVLEKKGFKNVAELAEKLGYSSPQKIYRLKQEENSKPSYDILLDFSNKFEDLNLRWFITGKGDPFDPQSMKTVHAGNSVSEPEMNYGDSREITSLKKRITELEIEKKSLLLALREIGAGHSQSDITVDSKKKKSD